jgi:hypothetical protein
MYVVLSKAEKRVHSGELVGTTACMMLKMRSHTKLGHYNSIELYLLKKHMKYSQMGDSGTCVLYMGRPVSKG